MDKKLKDKPEGSLVEESSQLLDEESDTFNDAETVTADEVVIANKEKVEEKKSTKKKRKKNKNSKKQTSTKKGKKKSKKKSSKKKTPKNQSISVEELDYSLVEGNSEEVIEVAISPNEDDETVAVKIKNGAENKKVVKEQISNYNDILEEEIFIEEFKKSRKNIVEAGDDIILSSDPELAVFKQLSNTVMWKIDGLYKDNGELYSSKYLKKNPPIFVIENSDGSTAELLITKNLSFSLREAFDRIYRGYYGVSKKERKIVDPQTGEIEKTSFQDYIKDNPLKVGFVVLAIVMVLVMLFIF